MKLKTILGYILFPSLLLCSCEKPEKIVKVSTLDIVAEDVSYTSATVRGEIIDAGDKGADEHGMLLSEFATLDMSNSTKESLGKTSKTVIFESTFEGLTENTVYYFRAYATSGDREILGGVKQFKTLETGMPQLSTLIISEDIAGAIKMSYDIISDGGEKIESAGIVWSYDPDPDINVFLDSIMFNNVLASFDTTLYSIKCDTTIYFKAFASNSKGTQFGTEISFNTQRCPGVPEVSTTAITNISETSASSGGTITFDGHSEISDKGICWSLNSEPTIADSTNSRGTGSDQFSAELTGLFRNGTYYVRAYATNEYGTAYGEELTFTTVNNLVSGTFTDNRDGIDYEWVEIGGQVWMRENLKYLPSVNPGSSSSPTVPHYYVYGYEGTDVSEAKALTNYPDYGTLYNWVAAMGGSSSSSENPSGVQGVCPTGWHLPSDNEYKELEMFLGLTQEEADSYEFRGTDEGLKLKSVSGWNNSGNGTDESGFNALPAGYRHSGSSFLSIGDISNLWTSREDATGSDAFYRHLNENDDRIRRKYTLKESGFSIRCVQDKFPTVETVQFSSVTSSYATVQGEVLDEGRGSVSEYGICWNTSGTATTSDSKISAGSGLGLFESNLSGLTFNTTYHARAYAINEFGTSYGDELTFTTLGSTSGLVTDAINGDVYPWVEIGNQVWMAENLKATKFSDGSEIPNVTDLILWGGLSTSAYAWYNNDEAAYKDIYGALYNWYTVDTKKLCPEGWHIPTDQEWLQMINFLGGWSVSGGKLKVPGTTYWRSTNVGASNSSGFNGRGAGIVNSNTGFESFGGIRETAYYWSFEGNWRQLFFANTYFEYLSGVNARHGVSVRCVKD